MLPSRAYCIDARRKVSIWTKRDLQRSEAHAVVDVSPGAGEETVSKIETRKERTYEAEEKTGLKVRTYLRTDRNILVVNRWMELGRSQTRRNNSTGSDSRKGRTRWRERRGTSREAPGAHAYGYHVNRRTRGQHVAQAKRKESNSPEHTSTSMERGEGRRSKRGKSIRLYPVLYPFPRHRSYSASTTQRNMCRTPEMTYALPN
jgi:hypothetical protein